MRCCDGFGRVIAFPKNRNTLTPTIFRCGKCLAAQNNGVSEKIPTWNPRFSETYSLDEKSNQGPQVGITQANRQPERPASAPIPAIAAKEFKKAAAGDLDDWGDL
jgi:hypothetical protein